MRKELTFADLDTERVELLPARETLFVFAKYNWAAVHATNTAVAINAGGHFSSANALAGQHISVNQS